MVEPLPYGGSAGVIRIRADVIRQPAERRTRTSGKLGRQLKRLAREVTETRRRYVEERHDLEWLRDQLRPLRGQIEQRLKPGTHGHYEPSATFCQPRPVLDCLVRRAASAGRHGLLDEYASLGTFFEVGNIEMASSPATRSRAIRNALEVAILMWGVIGAGCFGFGAELVARYFGSSVEAAFALDFFFLAAALFVIREVVTWQHEAGETIHDLGWRRSTTAAAVASALGYGFLWTVLVYSRGGSPFAFPWQRPVMAGVGLVLAFAEDLATLGFFMEQLGRIGMSNWLQAVTTGTMMGVYHGVLGFHYSVVYAVSSAILFATLSAIFLWGKRSLTPSMLAHSMVHVLGDPTLTCGILVGLLAVQ